MLRVAVVGGGIGGLSTAVALRATGADVHVFEQAHQLSEVGAGLGLQPNGQRVLVRLGLGPEINRIGSRLKGFRICGPDGSVVSEETYPAGVTQLGVHRSDMVAVLAAALPPGVVHTGHRCVRLSQHNEFAVVSFDNGVSVKADVVIAADGIHSVLQRYVIDATVPVFSGTVAYRGLIPASPLQGWPEYLVIWGGGGRHLLVFPVRGGELLNYVGFVPADEFMRESWSAPGDPATLAAEFADWSPQARRLLAHVDTTFTWGLYDREPLTRWTQGRLCLLGDAAHPMLPHMGQGANQAIEDAMALATLLRGASAADVPEALTRYETLRRDRTARIQRLSRTNGVGLDAGSAVRFMHPWVRDYDVEAAALTLSHDDVQQRSTTDATIRSSGQGCSDADLRGQGPMNGATLGDVQ
jgi:salicylate hydroxylase